jgi:mannose-6-phosphate isomerase-like protein (cupin superfamily)
MKEIVNKKWGKEIIIHNDEDYCGKILIFNKGGKFSMHYHMIKKETWYVNKGAFILHYINTDKADKYEITLLEGMTWHIPQGCPHQLEALEDSEIFEVSTQHFDDDSYRIEKGDNQC